MAARRDTPLAGDDLFGAEVLPQEKGAAGAESTASALTQPLADRLRPATLADVVGQGHLLGPEGALSRMLERGSLASLILWGGPGVGKTTIARLLAKAAGL
ncbi:MAG: AAA family ATPase, partial [Acetobacter papayae]